MTKTIRVYQTTLSSNGAIGYGMTGYPYWGGLTDTFNQGWDGTSGSWGLNTIPGYMRSGVVYNMNVNNIAANVTYLHAVPQISGNNGTNYNWATINNFIENRDAWTVISIQSNDLNAINNSNSPLKKAGYGNASYGGATNAAIYTAPATTGTKIYQFLMDKGNTSLTPGMLSNFFTDGIHTTIPVSGLPSSAVVIMSRASDAGRAILIIDIEHKFMYIGESQIFWRANELNTGNRGLFLNNLMYFTGNAMKYGSHFTDLLNDELSTPIPPPWDDIWGANKGVPSK